MNKNTELRQRTRRAKITEMVRNLDSFPKMPPDYKQYTGVGGIMTLFMYFFMLWLILSEITYYFDVRILNKFVPDVEFNEKLKINVDMTIAMPCREIGADIVDVTNQESLEFGTFHLEDTWFEMCPEQKMYFEDMNRFNTYFKEKYHSLRHILWRAGYFSNFKNVPRSTTPDYPHDACRVYGELELNKVAGNFHITLGKSLSVPGGHIHLQQFFPVYFANFSHRIDRLSFGNSGPGILHPLDSTMKITNDTKQVYKYFIEVISTDINTNAAKVKTYQYSVKELSKLTDGGGDSHEMSGIFFKYDTNPLKIVIKEEKYTLLQLILRICGCAGGLYIVAGLMTNVFEAFVSRRYGQTAHVSGKFVSPTKVNESNRDI
ncbi:endoplasmic reticulum-Golgi intermediate compartment protein 2 [Planococcus citri]|uniref:endoplasmic reticulum-Golgi intermediate compartment protein 2 n=1 Tax=Planococcus citri TaxID=170843 RepID=UPI0031FA0500